MIISNARNCDSIPPLFRVLFLNRLVTCGVVQGMGEAAAAAGNGGAPAGDGGAGDARALRRRRRAPGPAAQHTAARRRVRPRRALTVTSPLSGP